MIEEHLEIFLHLDGVVIHLCYCEDPHFALPPYLQIIIDTKSIQSIYSYWIIYIIYVPALNTLYLFCTDKKHKLKVHRTFRQRTDKRTLCWLSKNGSSMSSPPSCTIHHTSMVPCFRRSWLLGKLSMFLATSRAWCAAVVSLTVSGGREMGGGYVFLRFNEGINQITFFEIWDELSCKVKTNVGKIFGINMILELACRLIEMPFIGTRELCDVIGLVPQKWSCRDETNEWTEHEMVSSCHLFPLTHSSVFYL